MSNDDNDDLQAFESFPQAPQSSLYPPATTAQSFSWRSCLSRRMRRCLDLLAGPLAARAPSSLRAASTSAHGIPRPRILLASRTPPPWRRNASSAAAPSRKTNTDTSADLTTLSLSPLVEPVLSAFAMRSYQTLCIEKCLDALERGVDRMAASLPTGSGKTTIFVNLLHAIPPRLLPDGRKATCTLIIVNGIELARQTAQQLQKLFPDTRVEVEQGKSVASGYADVTVATIQTLTRGTRLDKFDPSNFKCVIVDEAHHSVAQSYRRTLHKFNQGVYNGDDMLNAPYDTPTTPYSASPVPSSSSAITPAEPLSNGTSQVPIIGFSATFSRHDRLALGAVFAEIVYHHELATMIEEKWLAPAKFVSIDVDMDLSGVEVRGGKGGDYVPSSLADVVDTDEICETVVRVWRHRAADRKSTLVFAVDIKHVHSLTQRFRQHGIDARLIYSDTPPRERRTILDDFRAGVYPVLVNCAVLTEGADVPNIDCVFLVRPTRSRSLLTQMVGRGLRNSPGKKDCLVMDILGSIKKGMAVKPGLEGLDPADILSPLPADEVEAEQDADEADSRQEDEEGGRKVRGAISVSGVTYTNYDSPFEIEEEYSGVRDMHLLSRNGWVGVGSDVFVLDLMGWGWFTVAPAGSGTWSTSLVRNLQSSTDASKKKVFTTPILISTTSSLGEAISAADVFSQSRLSSVTGMPAHALKGLHRFAAWRKKPASKQQMEFLRKRLSLPPLREGQEGAGYGVRVGDKEWTVKMEGMSKGQAANLLTRLQHGVKKRLEGVMGKAGALRKVKKERPRGLVV